MECGAIRTVAMLDVNGADIAALGFRGAEIGLVLSTLLRAAALGICRNERTALLDLAKSLKAIK